MKDCIKNIKDLKLKHGFINDEYYNDLKNILKDKVVNIYSCGPSMKKFHDLLPKNDNIINVCVKTSINMIDNCDILILDNRIKAGNREYINFDNNNLLTIFFSDGYFENYNLYVNSLPPIFKFPKNDKKFMNPDILFSPDNKYNINNFKNISLNEYINNNIIYGHNDLFVPLIYKLLILFTYMGVTKFNITGWDGFITHEERSLGYDTFLNVFYDNILDYSKFDITLYSDCSHVDIKTKRHQKLNFDYHIFTKIIDFQNNILYTPKNYEKLTSLTYYEKILFSIIVYLIVNNFRIINVSYSRKKKKINNIDLFIDYFLEKSKPINLSNILKFYRDIIREDSESSNKPAYEGGFISKADLLISYLVQKFNIPDEPLAKKQRTAGFYSKKKKKIYKKTIRQRKSLAKSKKK